MNVIETLLYLVAIPAAIYGLITLVTLRSKFASAPRYRPGQEWEYPPVGVVFAVTPSSGHDTVMLDYRDAAAAEPRVVFVDEDREPREVAPTFAEFLAMLTPSPE